jgi:hypothetical protein
MPCENGCARYRSGCLQARSLRTCVTVRVVNVLDVEMEEGPGRDGFWFRAAIPTRSGCTGLRQGLGAPRYRARRPQRAAAGARRLS